MADGIRIGEVDQDSVIVWTRLTRDPERNTTGPTFSRQDGRDGKGLDNLDERRGAVPGAAGEVRVIYWLEDGSGARRSTDWQQVVAENDYVHKFRLEHLTTGQRYSLLVEGRKDVSDNKPCKVEGNFRTAPSPDIVAPVSFTVITGQAFHHRDDRANGHEIYPAMEALNPDFFVHTGDVEYFDTSRPYATNLAAARFKWNRIYALPYQREFHRHVASYFEKDDHDILKDDCWPGQTYGDLTFDEGVALFREETPVGKVPYRTFRWGKDLQIWLSEGREFRSPNPEPDGPNKTIWGEKQKKWFFDTVRASDATFRVLISPTPFVGPDRPGKRDNHANSNFTYEGNQLRKFVSEQKNMFFICGDRHWQYVSVDPKTGLREYSCGPASDAHASGFSQEQRTSQHKYLKVTGGFLYVKIERKDGVPQITLRHCAVDGSANHEDAKTLQWRRPDD